MSHVPAYFYRQAAAVPFRVKDGRTRVLLVTGVSGKHWIVPKGVVDPGFTPSEAAANEAYEEAGVRGRVIVPALGSYIYEKWGGRCTVLVFPMRVDEVLDTWPEAAVRRRRWLDLDEAAERVHPPAVAAMITSLSVARREPRTRPPDPG